jgi:hypothetical protein
VTAECSVDDCTKPARACGFCGAHYEQRRRTGHVGTMSRDRLEDVTWMTETGEYASQAAARLGISYDALEKWCRNHAPDHWRKLCAREPLTQNPPRRKTA